MFLGQINNYTVPQGEANTVIPIKTIVNTNDKVFNDKGTISIYKSGNYNVDVSVTVEATTTQNVTLTLYADDEARTSLQVTIPTTPLSPDLGMANVTLVDAIQVLLTRVNTLANIYFAVDQSDVTINGYVRIEYFK